MTDVISEGRSLAAARLLGYSGFRGPFSLTGLAGGKNNQVYRVDLADQTLVLKAYFQHPGDPRDRLGAEYGFSTFAWSQGVRCLPQPMACDAESHLALYEFIPGRKLTATEVTATRVQEAINFFHQLNEFAHEPDAAKLPAGSEACFRFTDHLHCLERRTERLQQIEPRTEIDREAAAFVSGELAPLCGAVLAATRSAARSLRLSLEAELPARDRCLSPSDFGFHNALLTSNGGLKFLDFEYAGWDDPAKTVCDFFCQPELPAPLSCFEKFATTVAESLSDPGQQRRRIELLLPIYRLKWCCIMLNDFLAAGNQRRQFARAEGDEQDRKARQLAKARTAADLVAEMFGASAAA